MTPREKIEHIHRVMSVMVLELKAVDPGITLTFDGGWRLISPPGQRRLLDQIIPEPIDVNAKHEAGIIGAYENVGMEIGFSDVEEAAEEIVRLAPYIEDVGFNRAIRTINAKRKEFGL